MRLSFLNIRHQVCLLHRLLPQRQIKIQLSVTREKIINMFSSVIGDKLKFLQYS